jgi:hypothetical protein
MIGRGGDPVCWPWRPIKALTVLAYPSAGVGAFAPPQRWAWRRQVLRVTSSPG